MNPKESLGEIIHEAMKCLCCLFELPFVKREKGLPIISNYNRIGKQECSAPSNHRTAPTHWEKLELFGERMST